MCLFKLCYLLYYDSYFFMTGSTFFRFARVWPDPTVLLSPAIFSLQFCSLFCNLFLRTIDYHVIAEVLVH